MTGRNASYDSIHHVKQRRTVRHSPWLLYRLGAFATAALALSIGTSWVVLLLLCPLLHLFMHGGFGGHGASTGAGDGRQGA